MKFSANMASFPWYSAYTREKRPLLAGKTCKEGVSKTANITEGTDGQTRRRSKRIAILAF